jgi:hypothetical protein
MPSRFNSVLRKTSYLLEFIAITEHTTTPPGLHRVVYKVSGVLVKCVTALTEKSLVGRQERHLLQSSIDAP